VRGPQRALTHPRHGQPADFLFVDRGRRMSAFRLRKGLDQAVTDAGLTGRGGQATASDPAPAQTYLRDHPRQRWHVAPSANGPHGPRLGGDDAALRVARVADRSRRLRSGHDQGARPTVAVRRRHRTRNAPDRVEWLRSEMLKTRVAHGYCSRDLVAEACPYANICEQCDNYVAAPEFQPALEAQLADVIELRDDARNRGWDSEVARHQRVIASIDGHLRRLKNQAGSESSP
jgi:hypothetical protein